jgi:hypothetical protein
MSDSDPPRQPDRDPEVETLLPFEPMVRKCVRGEIEAGWP